MKIKQYWLPPQFNHFHEEGNIFSTFLKSYTDVNAPSFFYSTRSIEQIAYNHKGPAIMIVNNDIRPVQNNLEWVKNRKDLYFISTSKLMSVYLDELGLDYVEFPWHVGNTQTVQPHPKGNSVYFYGEGVNDNLYGYHIFPRLMKDNFPHLNIIYARFHPSLFPFVHYTKEQLDEVYKKVFVSVRMTRFDGLSDSVQSLGIRGVKTIWNGGTPSALSYGSEQDIINHIRNEEKTIGQTDTNLSNICKKYLDPTNPTYDYIFNLETYSQPKETPKLFTNDKPLKFHDFNEVLDNRFNMQQPLTI